MKTYLTMVLTMFLVALLLSACNGSGSSGGSGGGQGGGTTQTQRLMISNQCAYTIWIQQQNMPVGVPSVVQLASGASQEWTIPNAGVASTRFWPKKGCDTNGQNCTIGQSSDPCPEGGCPRPVDSKLEATWGCLLSDPSQCAVNPSNPAQTLTDTYWNMSAVDGYTFPFTATVASNTIDDAGAACVTADCSALSLSQCPTSENLSAGMGGTVNNAYASVNLQVQNGSNVTIGCYSPCKAMNYPTFGGQGLSETSAEAALYCCPTPPVSSDACSAGPVIGTGYVTRVHTQCDNTVYTYAYDDTKGLRHCSAGTMVHVTFGPNCP